MNEAPACEVQSHIPVFKMRKGRLTEVKPLALDSGEELEFLLPNFPSFRPMAVDGC